MEREIPVTEEKPLKSKKGLYRIIDEFFQFWFRFVFPRRSELEMWRIDDVLKDIRLEMPQYLSTVYEKIAVETIQKYGKPLSYTSIGRWWDKNEEIDIVGVNRDLNAILFVFMENKRKIVKMCY